MNNDFNLVIQVEPYVYFTNNQLEVLFYNTINGDHIEYNLKHKNWMFIKNVILINTESVSLEDKIFISTLEDRHFAYINNLSTSFFSINFYDKIINEFKELEILDSPFNRDRAFNLVTEITITLNQLDLKLSSLDFLKKQYNIFSNIDKTKEFINVEMLESIFNRYSFPNLKYLILSGSSLLDKTIFYDIMDFISPKYKIKLFISYTDYIKYIDKFIHFDVEFNLICDQYFIDNIQKDFVLFEDSNIVFNYYLNDVNGLEFLERNECLINKLEFRVYPYYSNNKHFLSKIISYKKNRIFTKKKSLKKIARNCLINELLYGKIIIHNDGDIFSNIQLNPIGNVNTDSFSNILHKISRDNYSWLFPRNKYEKCIGCLYNCFCPPLTLIELISNDTYCEF